MKKNLGLMLQIGGNGNLNKGFQQCVIRADGFPYFSDLKDNECHIILVPHYVEHLKPWEVIRFMSECWRILKVNGQLAISTPYAGSPGWWSDPTHCTGWNEHSFAYFDPDFEAYNHYKPKPWKIEKGNPIWQNTGNLECLLRPRK